MSSLVKFFQQTQDQNGSLYWGRADIDGAPFRGTPVPGLTEDEAENRLTRIAEPSNRIFDLQEPEDNKAYLEVLDKASNGWAQILHKDVIRIRSRRTLEDGTRLNDIRFKVYVEWIVYCMVDGKPMHSQRPYIGRPNE